MLHDKFLSFETSADLKLHVSSSHAPKQCNKTTLHHQSVPTQPPQKLALGKLLPGKDQEGAVYPPFCPQKTKGSSVLKEISVLQISDYFVSLISDVICPLLQCFLTKIAETKFFFLSFGGWMRGSSEKFCAHLLQT